MFDYRAGPPPAKYDPARKHMLYRVDGAMLRDCTTYTGLALLAGIVVAIVLSIAVNA